MKKIEYQIEESQLIGNSIIFLNLIPKLKDKTINFRPGQYGLVSFLRGNVLSQERPFSFVSSPVDKSHLQFGFKVFGQFTNEFAGLKKGDSVFVQGPYGSFIYDERKYTDSVFLAAGIGITPFMSIFRYATQKKISNNLTLLFSNKTLAETPFYNEIKNIEKFNKNFKAVFTLTGQNEKIPKDFIEGRINEETILYALNGKVFDKTYFICGPQLFNETMINILKRFGVKAKNIKTEEFSLAPQSFFEKGTWAFPTVVGAGALLMILGLYLVNQIETDKALLKAENNSKIAYAEKINQMMLLNQNILNNKNSLLTAQSANTKISQTTISQPIQKTILVQSQNTVATSATNLTQIPAQESSTTIPQESAPTPEPKSTPTPKTTPKSEPTPDPKPAPTPAPESAPPAPEPAPEPTPAPAPTPEPTPIDPPTTIS